MLKDFKLVDMKRSEINKEKSDPKHDKYEFEKKVYYKEFDDGTFGPYHFEWKLDRKEKHGADTHGLTYSGWTFVEAPKSGYPDYWPEPVIRDENGRYVYKDTVLMMLPIKEHIKNRKRAIDKADNAPLAKRREFQNLSRKDGADIDDASLAKLLGIGGESR